MLDNEIAKLVNELTNLGKTYGSSPQLRQRISSILVPILKAEQAEIERLKADLTVAKVERDSAHENVGDLRAEIERLREVWLEDSVRASEDRGNLLKERDALQSQLHDYTLMMTEKVNVLQAKLDAATKVPLTDGQIDKPWANESINTVQKIVRRRIVRNAEAAHNIKGTTP